MSLEPKEDPRRRWIVRNLSLLLLGILTSCQSKAPAPSSTASAVTATEVKEVAIRAASAQPENGSLPSTQVLMHNVILNEGPSLKLRVRWLRGWLRSTRPGTTPSFDDPRSFLLDINTGVVGISLADLAVALNGGLLDGSLTNVSLAPFGEQIKVNGTLHKGIPLPFEMIGDLAAAPDGRIHMHVAKLRVLKIPLKGILKAFDLKAGDLVGPKGARGVEVAGNDLYFDPEKILPEPQKRGRLTDVHLKDANIVETYGSAQTEVVNSREWRNFIRLRGGSLSFGKLTMNRVDLVMIDISDDPWFKFDLAHYQEQLVNGYTRMTPQAGVQIFMPDIDKIPRNRANQDIGLQWTRNRNIPPPPEVMR